MLGLEAADGADASSDDDDAADDKSDATSSADDDDDIDEMSDHGDGSDAASSVSGSEEEEDQDEAAGDPTTTNRGSMSKKQKTGQEADGLGSVGWDASDEEDARPAAPAAAGMAYVHSDSSYELLLVFVFTWLHADDGVFALFSMTHDMLCSTPYLIGCGTLSYYVPDLRCGCDHSL